MSSPAKTILFNGHQYHYLRNKKQILLYTGYDFKYQDCIIVVEFNPKKDEYYVLHMITPYIHYSMYDDVDDEMEMKTTPLNGINRMAKRYE